MGMFLLKSIAACVFAAGCLAMILYRLWGAGKGRVTLIPADDFNRHRYDPTALDAFL